MEQRETVAVVGLGYVGLPLALLAARKEYSVIGVDVDAVKVQKLTAGQSPGIDGITPEDLAAAGITFTSDFAELAGAGIIVICVPTPVDSDLRPNLGPVRGASSAVAQQLKPGQLVILESTVNPGVSESVVLPILESVSGLKGGRDFHLAHCPERINPGDKTWSVANIPRVIGSLDPAGLERAVRFYSSIIEGEIRPMGSLKEAEAVKVVENSFRDINIAFVNELAMSFDKLGINVVNVINGAATKPFAFMAHYPGAGVGGHCIPVDPYYLIEYAREHGFHHGLLSKARSINRMMPHYTAELMSDLLEHAGSRLAGAKVAVLGISYKPDISDTRESPAHIIIEALRQRGAEVVSYDPYVPSTHPAKVKAASPELAAVGPATPSVPAVPADDDYFESLHPVHQPLAHVLDGVDAVVVATGHRLFREMDPSMLARAGVRAVVDGRNCLDRDSIEALGILYKGIGY
jgi:UDP-N-acetyl-D-glucosamine dehydrogenase